MSAPTVAQTLRRRLRAARRRITAAAALRGALVTAAVVGAAVLAAVAAEAGLWLGVGLRTTVFWLLAALLGGLAVGLVAVPLLRGLGVLPGLDERAVVRRAGRDYAGVDDRLATLLDLADGHAAGQDRLRLAALDALGREVEAVPFERVRAFGPARRAAPWALVPAALLAGLFLGAPHTVGAAAARLMAPGVYFAPPAPFRLDVTPGDAEVTRGASLPVRVVAVGRDLPLAAEIEFGRADERATETVRLQRGDDGAFAYTVEDVRASLRYRVLADGVRTGWYRVEAVDRPLVRGVRVVVVPPGYSGRPARALPEGVGDATGLAGSAVRVRVAFGGPRPAEAWLDVAWDDGRRQRVALRVGDESAAGAFRLRGAGTYSVRLRTKGGLENADPARYSLGVLTDGPPQIALVEGADGALSGAARRLVFRVTDDFGFRGGGLVYRVGGGRARRLALPVRPRPLDQEVALDWRIPGARPGDTVEFYGEVRDNDAARGGKVARTPLFTVRFPTLSDRLDAFQAERDTAAQALDDLNEQAEESGERLQRLRDDLRQSLDPDWEDRRQVDELLREQSEMQRRAQELQQQMDRLSQELQNSDLVDEETQRQFDAMRRVMEELDSPELRDALQRLRDAIERLDLQEMLQQSEEAAQSEEELRRRLDRAMELMKRLEAAVEMEETARRAEDLAETEERLARETEALRERADGEREDGEREESEGGEQDAGEDDRPLGEERSPQAERERLAEEQREAAEDAEALEEQMRELQEQLEDTPRAPTEAVEQMQEQMQQDGGLPQQMQENAQQLQRNQLRQAQDGQEEMARRLRRLAREMRQQSQGMQGQQQRVDQAAVRRALEDALTLSREQERLAVQTARIPSRNPALVPAARRQGELRDGLAAVVDSLRRVARTVPQLGPEVDERAGAARREMDRAVERLVDRQSGPSVAHQRAAMSHLNELALLLTDLLDQLQNPQQGSGQGEGQGQGQGGGMSPQMMRQMGQRQAEINRRIQQMLNESAGERLSPGEGRQLRGLAEQQEALRRQLQRAVEGAGDGLGAGERSQLRRVEEQMEEAARELRRGQLDRRAAPRQQEILEKLLEAERSVNQQGREEQREAQTGRDRPPERALDAVRPGRPADRVRQDLIRALESGYAPDYQDLIKAYFERLQRRVEG